jgi:hypothetical protein
MERISLFPFSSSARLLRDLVKKNQQLKSLAKMLFTTLNLISAGTGPLIEEVTDLIASLKERHNFCRLGSMKKFQVPANTKNR